MSKNWDSFEILLMFFKFFFKFYFIQGINISENWFSQYLKLKLR